MAVKKFNPNKEPDCDKCRKVKVLPENIIPYNIITKYNPIIWDRERISAYGIKKALDWSFINTADYPTFSGKIIAYFKVRHQVDNKTKAMAKKK